MKIKLSISALLIGIVMAGILAVTLTISLVFAARMRALTTRQIEAITREQTKGIRNSLIQTFQAHEQALFHAAAGLALLNSHAGGGPLTARTVPEEEMRGFLSRIKGVMGDAAQVFMANNAPTYEEGGYAVFFPPWDFGGNYNQLARPWYTGAKGKAGAVSYTDPYLAMATGIVSTSLSTVIYDQQNNDLGVIVLDIAVSALTALVDSAKEVKGLDTWLLNKEGLYISNKDAAAVMQTDFFEDHALTQYKRQVLHTGVFYAMDKERIICSSIIPGAEWVVVSTIPRSVVFAEVNQVMLVTVLLALGLIGVLAAVLIAVIHRISKPIVTIALALKAISEGEGDLTRQIAVSARNEIGDLAHYFNLTLEKIRGLVIIIKNHARDLQNIGNSLALEQRDAAAAIREIAASMRRVEDRILNQSAGVTETRATMENISASIGKLNSHIEQQAAGIARSSSAIEEMLANIRSVTATLAKNGESVQALQNASEAGHGGLREVSQDIQEIACESEGLLEINAVMQNIASQTNLLSMNAAIEAAHAGEAGKGFAVVAAEIRKLAESSGKQSKTISAVLKKIKGSIDTITRSTSNVLNRFEAIDGGVKTVADQEENIRIAMEEQGAGSRQILEAASGLNALTGKVKEGSESMLEGSKQVILESKNLETLTAEIAGGMQEMTSGVGEVNAAVDQVNVLCGKNRETIEDLVKAVSRFKVE